MKRAVVVKPARLSLARVSCLRGEGPMAGVPFIDAFTATLDVIDWSFDVVHYGPRVQEVHALGPAPAPALAAEVRGEKRAAEEAGPAEVGAQSNSLVVKVEGVAWGCLGAHSVGVGGGGV